MTRCPDCGAADPHETIGWPVCDNNFHEEWQQRRWPLNLFLGPKSVKGRR